MDKETEKLQWEICGFCGSERIPDPKVVDRLSGFMRHDEAVKEAERSVYRVCPNKGKHPHPKDSAAMFPPEKLEDGAYYHGFCRNAQIARWNATTKRFVYMREKFGHVYPEEIGYWVDAKPGEVRFDEFRPFGKMENPPFEIPMKAR